MCETSEDARGVTGGHCHDIARGAKNGISLPALNARTDFGRQVSGAAMRLGEQELDLDAPPRQAFLASAQNAVESDRSSRGNAGFVADPSIRARGAPALG